MEPLGACSSAEDARLGLCDSDEALGSWEPVHLLESSKKLLDSSPAGQKADEKSRCSNVPGRVSPAGFVEGRASPSVESEEVDCFLKEVLRNRDRLTVLRLEQKVDRFMRNPKLQQLDFQPMPSSYLRLLAHRVAQHYNLQSSVIDSNIPEGTHIIARKTPESRFPSMRLADIPVGIPREEKTMHEAQHKVEIKRRPLKGSRSNGVSDDFSLRLNSSKSMEERKEEYNKARARIFSSNDLAGKPIELEVLESLQNVEGLSNGSIQSEKKAGEPCNTVTREKVTDGLARTLIGEAEREFTVRGKVNSTRVAIFRDREKDRKDPDYDRSYDRCMQRFDPGFGMNLGPLGMQATCIPVVNYNTEFPQLGGPTRPQMCIEPPTPQASQPLQGPWEGTSSSFGYELKGPMMVSSNPGHLGPHSGSGVYMHPSQFTCPSAAMTYIDPQQHFQKTISQSHLQSEGSISQARRR